MGHRPEVEQSDEQHMRTAIAAAWGARRSVTPRPWVGAVLVPADGTTPVVSATEGRTGPHAEAGALLAAGGRAQGATVYSTLEPCSHHGVSPPCADALVAAGVARVVVGITDPDPRVAGEGVERLRAAGIDVGVGVCAAEVEAQLAPYLTHRRTGRPFVVLKLAATLDGRTAAPDATSRWITGAEARLDAHRLRADSDAVLVGAGTVRADDPALTVRLPAAEQPPVEPRRVVLGRAPAGARVHPAIEVEGELGPVLDGLGADGVVQLMVEGGAGVAAAFHREGLVDRYVVYLAPALFGGDDARGMFAGPGAATIGDLWRGRISAVTRLGDDVRIDLEPAAPSPPAPSPPAGPGRERAA